MSKKTNAGISERGCLNVTTEKYTSWTLFRREKTSKTNFQRLPKDKKTEAGVSYTAPT